MMKISQSKYRSQTGSVAVEFALFSPFMFVILFSIIEMGSAWYQKQMMVSASREGARFCSLFENKSEQEVEAYILDILDQSGFPNDPDIDISGADANTGDLVSVRISCPYRCAVLSAFIPSVSNLLELSASTVMRHE
ncbi:MAG: pilus assembly protein [Candidatus Magnetomorum sp.]|nr:pilus assembly protein [Candidatus Magnetomorum sp.]